MALIQANHGRVIRVAQAIRDVSTGSIDIRQAAYIAMGKAELPDELFDVLCSQLGNPDLFFDLK